jgi:hypothetical protein
MEGGEVGGQAFGILGLAVRLEAFLDSVGELKPGEASQIGDDFLGGRELRGFLGDLHQEVEVVGHDAEGEETDATELGALAEETEETIFLEGIKDEALVHDAGDAVVEGGLLIGGKLETRPAHDGERLPATRTKRQAHSI